MGPLGFITCSMTSQAKILASVLLGCPLYFKLHTSQKGAFCFGPFVSNHILNTYMGNRERASPNDQAHLVVSERKPHLE